MNFRQWFEMANPDWVLAAVVPPKPGTTPIPPNHVRLYHYTGVEGPSDDHKHAAAELLRTNGLDIAKAKGATYGEPNVVWASRQMPDHGKVFAEFCIDANDPRWGPYWRNGNVPREGGDCYFTESIRPDEIIAVYEPWHHRYHYMVDSGLIDDAKAGEYDRLLDTQEYGPAVRKAKSN